jgi:hypothetical protein
MGVGGPDVAKRLNSKQGAPYPLVTLAGRRRLLTAIDL